MYCEFFGFKEPPFSITPNPRFIFLSKNHKEAYAHLLYGIDRRAGFIELTGEVGSGKTTILRSLLSQLDDENHRSALIFNPRLSADELLRTINREFGIQTSGSIDELMHTLNLFLLRENSEGRIVVLIIDEAQNLDTAVLEQIRMISNLETDTAKLIQIVLAGQPELTQILAKEELRQLSQRITVSYHLNSLDFEDIKSYINHRLEIAGGWHAVTFTPSALRKIYTFTKGLPRLLNVLCDRTLLIAYTEESREISAGLVSLAIAELNRETRKDFFRRPVVRWFIFAAISLLLTSTGYFAGKTFSPLPGTAKPQKAKLIQNSSSSSDLQSILIIKKDLASTNEVESAVSSFNELARLWNVRPVVDYHIEILEKGLTQIAKRRGLNLYQFRGSLKDLIHSDSPCIIEVSFQGITGKRYLALTRTQFDNFIVSPVHLTAHSLNERELSSIWSGRAFIPWKDTINLPERTVSGKSYSEIKKLQTLLAKSGEFKGSLSGFMNKETMDALNEFRRKLEIAEKDAPGAATLIQLQRVTGTVVAPTLKLAGEQKP